MRVMATEKNVTLISFVFVIVFFVSLFAQEIGLCSSRTFCSYRFDAIAATVLPFLPLFLFSLITYYMKEVVFQAWFRFARIYIPAAVLLIFFAPSYTHNWMFPYEKGSASVIFSTLFIIASISIIISARMKSSK